MMKPKFDDVIEYVRAGEDDPDLKKLLELHPNGKELLKQARFICRMLERKAGKDEETGGPAIAALSASFDSFDSVAESRELPDSDWLYVGETSETVPRGRPRQKWSGRGRRPVEELGTLVFTEEDDRVLLSYEPSERVTESFEKSLAKFGLPKSAVKSVRVLGRSIQLSLPESVPVGEPLTVHLSHGARQMPASGQRMIFMPESGPFLKLEADKEWRIEIPAPEKPGALRVDTSITELLRIRLKK